MHQRAHRIRYKRFAVIFAFACVFAFVSYVIVQASMAESLLRSGQPEAALEWEPSYALALDALAQNELSANKEAPTARDKAVAALKSSPLNDQAVALIALDADRRGDRDLAMKLMRIAGQRSWRFPIAQAYLFSHDTAQQNYKSALEHLDALLRVGEDNMGPLIQLVASFTVQPEPSAALSEYLAQVPPWRTVVLESLSRRLRSADNLVRLFVDLKQTAAPPTERETAALLTRLVNDRRYVLAKEVAGRLQGAPDPAATLLYNGDFSRPLNGSPFNWQIRERPGVKVDIAKSADDAGGALHLDFGGRVPSLDVQQIIVVPPGVWALSGEVRAAQLQSDVGVGWQMTCADSAQALLESDLQTGTFDWKRFSITFRVPEQGCPAQRLNVVHPAKVASQEAIRGEAWYRNIQITPGAEGKMP